MLGVVDARRYEEIADWYEAKVKGGSDHDECFACDQIRRLDGGVSGLVVDLGCGTAAHCQALAAPGRTVVGIDISAGLLQHAQPRLQSVVVGDATRPPVRLGVADLVVSIFVHTDVPSALGLFRAAHDLLRPGGTVVISGAHPCFNSPFFGRDDDGRFVTYPGYVSSGYFTESPAWGDGIRSRVGMHHVPLGEYLNAVVDSGLAVEQWDEGGLDPPILLGFRARKR
jgi:SAM-dependent methyltransferase